MLVKEVMSSQPVTVQAGTTVQEALLLLAEHKVTSLPVVSREGRIRGVVSEADLIRGRVAADPRAHELPVEDVPDRAMCVDDVMTPYAVTVHPETDLAEAVDLITSTTVKSVPVVDAHGRVLGMLSRSDVVRVLAHTDRALEARVDAELTAVGLADWLVEAHDGAVVLTGPESSSDRTLARLIASRVPGVVEVRTG